MKKILILLITMMTASLYGAGFGLPEQGSKSISMGNAFTAVADDASAIFYNPSGITQLKGSFNMNIGAVLLMPKHEWKNETETVKTKDDYPVAPHLNFVYKVSPKLFLGLGVSAPYAAKIEWPDKWVASSIVEMMSLQIVDISPVLAYKVMKGLSLGLTYDLGIANVELRKRVMFSADDFMEVRMASSETGLGHGFKASLLYEIGQFKTGLVFKFGKTFNFKGNADFDITNNAFSGNKPQDQTMEVTLNLPIEINWGLAYEILPNKLLVSFDLQYTMWSSYNELKFEFEHAQFDLDKDGNPTNIHNTEKDWNNVFAFRFGTEFKVNPSLALRAGYVYDMNPVPDETLDPSLPDSDRQMVSLGIGYNLMGKIQLDLAYLYVLFMERESKTEEIPVLDGTYNSHANIISFTAGFKF